MDLTFCIAHLHAYLVTDYTISCIDRIYFFLCLSRDWKDIDWTLISLKFILILISSLVVLIFYTFFKIQNWRASQRRIACDEIGNLLS